MERRRANTYTEASTSNIFHDKLLYTNGQQRNYENFHQVRDDYNNANLLPVLKAEETVDPAVLFDRDNRDSISDDDSKIDYLEMFNYQDPKKPERDPTVSISASCWTDESYGSIGSEESEEYEEFEESEEGEEYKECEGCEEYEESDISELSEPLPPIKAVQVSEKTSQIAKPPSEVINTFNDSKPSIKKTHLTPGDDPSRDQPPVEYITTSSKNSDASIKDIEVINISSDESDSSISQTSEAPQKRTPRCKMPTEIITISSSSPSSSSSEGSTISVTSGKRKRSGLQSKNVHPKRQRRENGLTETPTRTFIPNVLPVEWPSTIKRFFGKWVTQ